MKIVYSWLKDFIDLDLTPEEMVQQFVHLGIEVASVQTTGADFEGVTVAQITHIEDHPNSDHLHLVDLDLGGGKTQRVVCGAPNIAVGQKIPLARVGSRLGTMVMKPAVIRGVASEGMICSSDELGLTHTRAHGILVLDENLPLGTTFPPCMAKKTPFLIWKLLPTARICSPIWGLRGNWGSCSISRLNCRKFRRSKRRAKPCTLKSKHRRRARAISGASSAGLKIQNPRSL